MHHATGIIEAFAIDRHARAAGFLEENHEFAQRDALVHRLDIGTRHHDVLDPDFPETQDVVEHGALGGREGIVAAALGHQGIGKIFAKVRGTSGPEDAGRPLPEGAVRSPALASRGGACTASLV